MFILHYFKITNHKYFGEIDLPFYEDVEERGAGFYTTLMIGPNGTGKSQILGAISEVFIYLATLKDAPTIKPSFAFKFIIKYLLFGKEYFFDFTEKEIQFKLHGEIASFSEIKVPDKILASSISLNDRYPLKNTKSRFNLDHYEYLGIKSSSNSAYISVHVKSIIDSLSDSAKRLSTIPNIKLLFEKLSLEPKFTISFKPGRRFILKEENENNIFVVSKSAAALKSYFSKYIFETRTKRLDERRLSKYEKLLHDDTSIENAVKFLIRYSEKFKQNYLYKIRLKYDIDFSHPESLQLFLQDSDDLKTLRDLEIFSVDNISLRKAGSQFKFEQASSGEYHLLTSFLGIISRIEDNSLILIDEPEISLHPNWQMQYMEVLNSVFENFKTCHFIVASHSHFLVSDLIADRSAILRLFLDKEFSSVQTELLYKDTFGWTPENILYNIFNVSTVGNHYFEMDLRNLAKLISTKSKDFALIREYITRFEKFEILPEDPLRIFINQAKGYLKEYEL
jgi:predicted ATP-dependent endonuclease of OLD family